jgi:hypothetical protein
MLVAMTACVTPTGTGGGGSPTPDAQAPTVSRLGLFWGPGETPCQAPVTMMFTLQVLNGQVGDRVVVALSGPGLPGQIDQQLPQNMMITGQFPVPKGSGVWTARVVSVQGKTPNVVPGASLTAQSSASC